MGSLAGGTSLRLESSLLMARRKARNDGHCATAISTGAKARDKRIEPAIITPGVISCSMAR